MSIELDASIRFLLEWVEKDQAVKVAVPGLHNAYSVQVQSGQLGVENVDRMIDSIIAARRRLRPNECRVNQKPREMKDNELRMPGSELPCQMEFSPNGNRFSDEPGIRIELTDEHDGDNTWFVPKSTHPGYMTPQMLPDQKERALQFFALKQAEQLAESPWKEGEMVVLPVPEKPNEAIPMILSCPKCGERHIDEGEFATKEHHTHACQTCGFVWRPALVPTVGVRFLPGFKNQAE